MVSSHGNTPSWGCHWPLTLFTWPAVSWSTEMSWLPARWSRTLFLYEELLPSNFSQSEEAKVYAGCLSIALSQMKLTFSGLLWYNLSGMIICLLNLWTMERGRAAGKFGESAGEEEGAEENKSLLNTSCIPFIVLNSLFHLAAPLRNRVPHSIGEDTKANSGYLPKPSS